MKKNTLNNNILISTVIQSLELIINMYHKKLLTYDNFIAHSNIKISFLKKAKEEALSLPYLHTINSIIEKYELIVTTSVS